MLLNTPKKNLLLILLVALVGSSVLVAFSYRMAVMASSTSAFVQPTIPPTAVPTRPRLVGSATTTPTPTPTPTVGVTPTAAPVQPASVLGVQGDLPIFAGTGVQWVRIAYRTCHGGSSDSVALKNTVTHYHALGLHVLMTMCQVIGSQLFNTQPFNDIGQAGPDAVQCGNEQMKYDPPAVFYVTPARFARFFDLCQSTVHILNPGIPVILGSLDPVVANIDYQRLAYQVQYLDSMEYAMNTSVHPNGHWSWRAQIVGLIDSWHNGYPGTYVNNLLAQFSYWSQQMHYDLYKGDLGRHMWVVEGTGCFKGCGINAYDSREVAIAHIFTLIIDVQTTKRFKVPFFYFSGNDFVSAGVYWPIGILDLRNHPKPLRQDLGMGSVALTLSCASGKVRVVDQLHLLGEMYNGCTLPDNYRAILT
ncbi:MAG: hypothetical protein H0W02_14405 [Ktedonobacteraceae bacterium]|nr:hypothetical protein [Ktedonobacteraceae bacterium]